MVFELLSDAAARLDDLVSAFVADLSAASHDYPNRICASRTRLRQELTRRRRVHKLPQTWTSERIIDRLSQLGLVHPLSTSDRPGSDLIALGLSPSSPETLLPEAVLSALYPAGIVSGATALAIHGLSTQRVFHHHITSLVPYHPAAQPNSTQSAPTKARRSPNLLGTPRLTLGEHTYYHHRRREDRLLGQQSWVVNRGLWVTVTDLPQTLLDTLISPAQAGGQAAVFEAWETAADSVEPAELDETLRRLKDPRLERRVGYLIDQLDLTPLTPLREHLDDVRLTADEPTPLLPGLGSGALDPYWQVTLPTP